MTDDRRTDRNQVSPRSRAGSHRGLALVIAAAMLGGAAPVIAAPPMGQPGIPYSGAKPAADMQAVIDAQQSLGLRPIETLPPPEARRQPSAADGVKEVLRRQGRPTTPPPGVTTRELTYQAGAGLQPARVYMPATPAKGPLPVILYFHGGGFVIADINVYDSTPRALVRETGAIVVSAEYRHAPEKKFPAQQEDAVAAYKWVLANAAAWGGDPAKVALVGESAGGNLAANVAIAARDQGLTPPVHEVLVYPVAVSDMNTPSKQANSNAKPLNRAMLMWFYHHTGRSPADANDPRLNLVAADLKKLPPTTIVLAEIDPLHDDGEMLGAAMKAAGDQVTVRTFPGVTHEFFGMDAVVRTAGDAQRFAGEKLRAAFAK